MIILKGCYDTEEEAAIAARQAESLGHNQIVVAWRKRSDGKWELVKF